MKFNIYYTLQNIDTKETLEAANKPNPVECIDLSTLLKELSYNLPTGLNVNTIGIRIENVE